MTQNTGGPAFPAMHYDLAEGEHGITVRDYFAAKAMQELLSQDGVGAFSDVARESYRMAAEMLAAREVAP